MSWENGDSYRIVTEESQRKRPVEKCRCSRKDNCAGVGRRIIVQNTRS